LENFAMSVNENEAAPASDELASRDPQQPDRRRFLNRISLALSGFAAVLVGVPIVGFLIAPLLREVPRIWRPVGAASDFKEGDIVEVSFDDSSALPWAGLTQKTAAWLYRQKGDDFVAYSANCSHLGCPVRWKSDAQLFLCPCHGGVYYKNGRVAAGPPPRGLTKYPVRVQSGNVEILTSEAPIT
jgi:menaquinol-cytochrome c reductase iron-sulfur subunit